MSHPNSNVTLASGVNVISTLLPGRSFTYLTPFGASTSISPPSTSRSREARYEEANMCVIRPRPRLTLFEGMSSGVRNQPGHRDTREAEAADAEHHESAHRRPPRVDFNTSLATTRFLLLLRF